VLVASGFGDLGPGGSGGGMFAVEGANAERIDRISTMGLAYDGRRLARVFRCAAQPEQIGEVAVYDAKGVQRYVRLDDATAVHDVAWDGENIVAVSTWHNAVRWFGPSGEVVHEVRYAGPTDNWHLNCVARRDDVWYATMFGPVGPAGSSSPAREGAGRLVRLATGAEVVGGLTAPHNPRWFEGLWLVCNSAKGELLAAEEETGRIVRRVRCGQWTRGIAWDDDFIYVGTSRRRVTGDSFDHAEIVVLSRAAWTVEERIAVQQAQEIYDLALISPAVHAGLRRGFDVNPLRVKEFRQHRLIGELGVTEPRTLWPSGDPLPWSDFRCAIACAMPASSPAADALEVPVRLTNRSRSFFTSAPPAPVYLSYKWLHPATGAFLSEARALRTELPRTVFPGESVDLTLRIVVPAAAGAAILRVTALQEGIAWFDDQDASNAVEFAVEITPAQPTVWEPAVR
jgi:acetolactate synthase-1/2/3 large subunit